MRTRRIVAVDPIFVVSDLPSAVTHYERLGFKIEHYDAGYAFAQRDDLTLHLARADEMETPGAGSLYLHVDDADILAEEWRAAGVEFVAPQNMEWGKYEGSHRDTDGNLIRFGSTPRR
jgi:catechol 2,3-dioxygenase-like lactoylglutathione lyase family enzyme